MSAVKKLPLDLHAQLSLQWGNDLVLLPASQAEGTYFNDKLVAIGDNISAQETLRLSIDHGISHICQQSAPDFDSEIHLSALMLFQPDLFLSKPLASILNPSQASSLDEKDFRIFTKKFSCSSEKGELLSDIGGVLKNLSLRESIVDEMRMVVDELFTNAVFNAPFVDLSSGASQGIDRSTENLKMPNGEFAEIFVGCDEHRVVMGARDPFGSLNVNKLLLRIQRCYINGVGSSINMDGKGGAGIGSYMVFEASTSYYLAVETGKSTVVCCSVPLKISSKKKLLTPKNIHFLKK